MSLLCAHCGGPVPTPEAGRLAPWCSACGVDFRACPPQASHAPDSAAAEAAAREWRDRFGLHNVGVGVLFFVWGTITTLGPAQSGGDKVLAAQHQLNAIVNAVQVVTLVNGAALVLSGVALRRGWRGGYPLAVGCALVLVVAGGVFLAGFRHLGGGPSMEHEVARLSFIRTNFDLIIGLVDGLGLLWFLSTRAAGARPEATKS